VRERLVISWVDPGNVSGRFTDNLLRWLYDDEHAVDEGRSATYRIAGHIRLETGPRLAPARNTIVRQFLSNAAYADVEWLLMIDSDMTFPVNFIETLMTDVRTEEGNIKRPVVGGLYFGGGHGVIFPVMYNMVDAKLNDGNPVKHVTDFTPGEIIPVDACGTGALLMHRGLLEYLATLHEEPAPWFAESMYKPEGAEFGQEFGEDFTFCMRVRQQEVPIYVNTGAVAGHVKGIEMTEHMWRTAHCGLVSVAPPTQVLRPSPALIVPTSGPNREQRRHPVKQ
jgi:hypothetical protein